MGCFNEAAANSPRKEPALEPARGAGCGALCERSLIGKHLRATT